MFRNRPICLIRWCDVDRRWNQVALILLTCMYTETGSSEYGSKYCHCHIYPGRVILKGHTTYVFVPKVLAQSSYRYIDQLQLSNFAECYRLPECQVLSGSDSSSEFLLGWADGYCEIHVITQAQLEFFCKGSFFELRCWHSHQKVFIVELSKEAGTVQHQYKQQAHLLS